MNHLKQFLKIFNFFCYLNDIIFQNGLLLTKSKKRSLICCRYNVLNNMLKIGYNIKVNEIKSESLLIMYDSGFFFDESKLSVLDAGSNSG